MVSINKRYKRSANGGFYTYIDEIELKVKELPPPVFYPTGAGKDLPPSSGFSFRIERPKPSLKTVRAMCCSGMNEEVDYILANKLRSTVTPDYIWAGVSKFKQRAPPRYDSPEYRAALAKLRVDIKVWEKTPLKSMSVSARRMPQNTSPGLPYIQTHSGWKKGEILKEKLPAFKGYWDRVGKGQPVGLLPDCAAFARSHIGSPDVNKVRPVWAYPIQVLVEEGRYALPIVDELTSGRIGARTAYGMEMMKGGMSWVNRYVRAIELKHNEAKYFMTDYSGFDASVPAWLIRDVFAIIMEKLDFTKEVDSAGNISELVEEETKRRYKKMCTYFINTVIRNCDGRRYQKSHGVPSGSFFTNIIGTFCNEVITDTIFGVDPHFTSCLGTMVLLFYQKNVS